MRNTGGPRKRFKTRLLCAAFAVLALTACAPKAVGPVTSDGSRLTWEGMHPAQRKNHMRRVVLPAAAAIFQEWRPERYARVDCTLCHGDAAHWEDFAMPTDHLPRLSGALLLGPEFKKNPATTRLKLDRLVPAMSEALGVRSFSLVTRSGFGCYSCHLGPDGPQFGK